MARIRTIKPEFFTSEDICNLTPLARLLYIALWCESDKEGRMVWKPLTFKLRYLPGDSVDINELCQELLEAKLVVLYGEGYAVIPAFKSHQHINPRESDSQLPEYNASSTRQSRVSTSANQELHPQGGREGKGRNIYTPPLPEKLLADYMTLRRAKKAGALTETAYLAIVKEAEKAGITPEQAIEVCCQRAWVGFKADWYLKDQPQQPEAPRKYL